MILTLIVIAVALISLTNLAMVVANDNAAKAASAAFKESKAKGLSVVFLNLLGSLVLVGLWTTYAIVEGDWRYAAITWIPFITNLIGKWAMK